MHTALCDELGIEFPIFAFTHCRDVVVAVSKAGGFGVLGAVGFTPEQLEIECAWIDDNIGDHPYGVDIVIPNKYEGMDTNMSGDELADMLERDLHALQDRGLDRLGDERERLHQRYAAVDHPAAAEVARWLAGDDTADRWVEDA